MDHYQGLRLKKHTKKQLPLVFEEQLLKAIMQTGAIRTTFNKQALFSSFVKVVQIEPLSFFCKVSHAFSFSFLLEHGK